MKIKIMCLTDNLKPCFLKSRVYDAKWDGDGCNEPKVLIAKDEIGCDYHILAEYNTKNEFFHENFYLYEVEK